MVIYTSEHEQFRNAVGDALEERLLPILQRVLPDVVRRATLPSYLTKAKLMELTGWSSRQVEYKKAKRQIPFIKRGRLILFPTEDVFAYLEEGRVPAKPAEK